MLSFVLQNIYINSGNFLFHFQFLPGMNRASSFAREFRLDQTYKIAASRRATLDAKRSATVEPVLVCLSFTKTLRSDLLENCRLVVSNFPVAIRADCRNLAREKSFSHRWEMMLEYIGQVNITDDFA